MSIYDTNRTFAKPIEELAKTIHAGMRGTVVYDGWTHRDLARAIFATMLEHGWLSVTALDALHAEQHANGERK